jgi:hypothetical protein
VYTKQQNYVPQRKLEIFKWGSLNPPLEKQSMDVRSVVGTYIHTQHQSGEDEGMPRTNGCIVGKFFTSW